MGEARKDALRLDFDRRLKVEFHGTKVANDAELLTCRELDEALGLTSAVGSDLCDIRTGGNTQHGLAVLLRQSIYNELAGYEDAGMTGNGARTRIAEEKLLVEMDGKGARMLDLQRIGVLWGLCGKCIGRIDGRQR